jgi:hypothetical protein
MTTAPDRTVSERKDSAAHSVTSDRHSEPLDATGRGEFTAWLIASCERQDVPVTITDPTALAAIATLLR